MASTFCDRAPSSIAGSESARAGNSLHQKSHHGLVLFFLVNGAIALFTALYSSDKIWALYNGLISYGLMGMLFVGEWLVRPKHKADVGNG